MAQQSAIRVFAGRVALEHITQHGLKPSDIRVLMGASGGPKWFVLSHLDRYLAKHWLTEIDHPIDLVGSSIGAWRMAAFAGQQATDAIDLLEHDYLHQRYSPKPTRAEITDSVNALVDGFIRHTPLANHQQRKLHIVTARCKGLTQSENPSSLAIAMTGVALGNAVSRNTLPHWFDRVTFSNAGKSLPVKQWDRFDSSIVSLTNDNYRDALLASGAIPMAISGIKNPSGAPKGLYRDGGMVDYHFDLPIKPNNGLVLYPHFSSTLKPGWFDKSLPWRKVNRDHYSHTVVIAPSEAFINSLPFQKIPDRHDFKKFDSDSRIRYWKTVVDKNKAIADAFHDWVNSPNSCNTVGPIERIAQ